MSRHALRHRPTRRLLDATCLLLTGAATSRAQTQDLGLRLRRVLPLACRSLIIPSVPRVGTSTLSIQLAALLTRTRGLPGLLLDASENPYDPSTPTWSARPGARPPTTAAQAHALVGITDDNLLGRLRLPAWRDERPPQWDDVRTHLFRFHDTVLTEAALMHDAHLLASAHHVHSVVLVSRATRADVEATRRRIAALAAPLAQVPRRPRLLHAVVATEPGSVLIPRLRKHETLIPFDSVLARTTATRTPAPGFIERPTGLALTRLAADIVDAVDVVEAVDAARPQGNS
ncbi:MULTISPECIES: hypothetical protein [Actinomyces]|uniref:MinD-like ATPase involved in chromosome partitioning or flagellar assembly n=1 Tax=Actinomyces respiraculi TaxID=2744574 RepID=A0A7T0LKY6_9ACTO|nr:MULTISPECIES: hypothetical protein [Actinomyces]QPL05351.1 hypothetical protein ID810_11700 [Actinomyces respiraculi]